MFVLFYFEIYCHEYLHTIVYAGTATEPNENIFQEATKLALTVASRSTNSQHPQPTATYMPNENGFVR